MAPWKSAAAGMAAMVLGCALTAACDGTTRQSTQPAPGNALASSARILYQSFTSTVPDTLFTMRIDGSQVRELPLNVPGPAISPDWSPDGRRIVFVVQQQPDDVQSLWTARSDGREARELLHCGAGCLSMDYPAWSPDGKKVAFTFYDSDPPPTAGPPASATIRVIDLSSGKQRVVARSAFPQLLDLPRWSPDGKHLVVQTDRFSPDGDETGSRIAVVRVHDGAVRPLTPFSMFAFHPDWSPAGGKIVFATYDFFMDPPADAATNLFTIRPDGTHQRQLTHVGPGDGERVAQATFTPDGRCVLFTYEKDSVRRAAFLAPNEGQLRLVPKVFATHPRLSPGTPEACPVR